MRPLSVALLLVTAGCGSILGSDERLIPAAIRGLGTENPAIQLPAEVRVGEEFTVLVGTGWSDGCARKGPTEVHRSGMTATIAPYDHIIEGAICTQALVEFTHEATLAFPQAGEALLAFRGSTGRGGGIATVERTVIVR
jgi:hypothetical protein